MAKPTPWVDPVTMTTRPFTPRLPPRFVLWTILDQKFQLSNYGKFKATILGCIGDVTFDKWNFFARINVTA
jgi:hypothetical protein